MLLTTPKSQRQTRNPAQTVVETLVHGQPPVLNNMAAEDEEGWDDEIATIMATAGCMISWETNANCAAEPDIITQLFHR